MRDHKPQVINRFNGLWNKGDSESCPIDHSPDCENVWTIKEDGVGTRGGVGIHQNVLVPLTDIVRIFNFVTQNQNTLIALTYDGVIGRVYHVVDSDTVYGPILSIGGMEDIAFYPVNGRAYISPFKNFISGDIHYQKGLDNEFVYVYLGDGTMARKAAGSVPAGTLTVGNGAAGYTDAGFHLFAVVGETDSGYLSAPVGFASFTTGAALSVSFTNVPVFVGEQWVRRHIVGTKKINNYNGNTQGYDYFFLPEATIEDNTTTSILNRSFYDIDLLDDASHLLDNYAEIPAVAFLSSYNDRLVAGATFDDINLTLVSAIGEPEAISQIDGLLNVPADGNAVTNAQELRDVLYLTKRNRTIAYVDNEDVPSSWKPSILDQAFGTSVHGIGTVIDSGGVSADYIIIATFAGICIFNGQYIIPELSWKISELWKEQDRNSFRHIQIVTDTIYKRIYISLPDRTLLIGDFTNGMDFKSIKWWPQRFDFQVNTIALVNINDLIIGAQSNL